MSESNAVSTMQQTENSAARMRKARINAGLSQREAAEKMGVGQSRVSNYENQINKNIPPEFLKQCAKAYNCSLEYLYGFTDEFEGGYAYRPIKKDSMIALNKNALAGMGLTLQDLDEIAVSDSAMTGAFSKGEQIIISKKIGTINKPAIYAIVYDNATVMRGLRKELSGVYTLFVHNKQTYDDQTLSEEEFKKLNIIGKYIGHWQSASN